KPDFAVRAHAEQLAETLAKERVATAETLLVGVPDGRVDVGPRGAHGLRLHAVYWVGEVHGPITVIGAILAIHVALILQPVDRAPTHVMFEDQRNPILVSGDRDLSIVQIMAIDAIHLRRAIDLVAVLRLAPILRNVFVDVLEPRVPGPRLPNTLIFETTALDAGRRDQLLLDHEVGNPFRPPTHHPQVRAPEVL